MRNRLAFWSLAGVAGLLALGSFGGSVSAASGTISLKADTNNFSFGGGGEFKVLTFTGLTPAPRGPLVDVPGSLFQTFCVEKDVTFTQEQIYNWTSSGSINGTKPLPPEAAYLFTHFWNGDLSNYNYTLGNPRIDSAGMLQYALWVLVGDMDESQINPLSQAETWITEARTAVSNHTWTGLGSVQVLSLVDAVTGANAQDVLVITSDPPPPPPPASGGGGLTPGFWHNKNGQKLIGAGDLAMLDALCLVKANGDDFDPTTKTQVANWILADADDNMAYKLSSMLAAMELNVFNHFVNAGALVYCPTSVDPSGKISIQALMDMANAELCLHPYTPIGNANRSWQETLKDVLDDANNNKNWVP